MSVVGSDYDSATSAKSDGVVSGKAVKRHRKRLRSAGNTASDSLSSDDAMSASGSNTPKRGRGRPATTGEHVGLGKARATLAASNKQAAKDLYLRQTEDELEACAQRADTSRKAMEVALTAGDDTKTALAVSNAVRDSVDVIQKVAAKSGNLKGTYQKALNRAAKTIASSLKTLSSRTVSDETALLQAASTRLEADNSRLQKELADLRKDFVELQVEVAKRQSLPAAPVPGDQLAADREELLVQRIMVQMGTMVNARFEAVDDRLLPEKRLRPPLAADAKKAALNQREKPQQKPQQKQKTASLTVAAPTPPAATASKKGKGKGKTTSAAAQVAPATANGTTAPTASTSTADEGWTVVARKPKKPKVPGGPSKPGPNKKAKKAKKKTKTQSKKLRPPRSSAVVIQLQPEAVERGVTYASVLSQARDRVPLSDLGVTTVRIKETATGARILEVPGVGSGDKADSIANRFREAFKEDIRVSRPVKTSELRISGLDDSITPDEVVTVVSRVGECQPDSIKAGEIRRGPSGMGAIWIRCPMAAASKVVQAKRLLIGWVSAQVRLLEARPTRCFRCLQKGHIRVSCKSEVDRSGECYRCGQVGHIARQCTSAPHCTACAAAGLTADHRMGTKACDKQLAKVPKKKRGQVAPQPTLPAATAGEEVVTMSD